jgi:hypothetical protein
LVLAEKQKGAWSRAFPFYPQRVFLVSAGPETITKAIKILHFNCPFRQWLYLDKSN